MGININDTTDMISRQQVLNLFDNLRRRHLIRTNSRSYDAMRNVVVEVPSIDAQSWTAVAERLPTKEEGEFFLAIISGESNEGRTIWEDAIEIVEYFPEEGWSFPYLPDTRITVKYWRKLPDFPKEVPTWLS